MSTDTPQPPPEVSLDSTSAREVSTTDQDVKPSVTTAEKARAVLEQLSLDDADPAKLDESCELLDELPHEEVPITTSLESESADDIKSALTASYLQYKASIKQLSRVSGDTPAHSITATSEETRADEIMSRTQHQLIVDEEVFWEQLAGCSSPDVIEAAAVTLAQKSTLVSDSYERRTRPPTRETYEQSMEILRAMGVPCLESHGAFEAEALASSLVLHGVADYVVSEDTVRVPGCSHMSLHVSQHYRMSLYMAHLSYETSQDATSLS